MIVQTILEALSGVFSKIPDGNIRAQVQAEATQAIMTLEGQLLDTAKEIATADSASESWLTRNARPLTVVWSLLVITWLVFIAPMFGLVEVTLKAIGGVPDMLWMLLTAGIGAYPLLKSIEALAKGRK